MQSLNPKLNPAEIAAALRDVTVTYDGYQSRALSRVNVEIRRGEVTGVLGAKDSGKSTLLKVLAGRLRAAEGSAKIFGHSARGGMKARVGFLPGKPEATRRTGFVERWLGGKKESPLGARGVARLAQALLGNRDFLVLDDVFAELNANEMAEAKRLIRDLVARGKTVVLASDALMHITDICSRFIILHEGRVQAVGTLEELLAGAGAIRFLPAVLPKEMVERVLAGLRGEILSSANSPATAPMAKPAASNPTETAKPDIDDPIDHEKLKGLMKPPAGQSQK
jgi:ABC-2 type transport system ATP-binding protein